MFLRKNAYFCTRLGKKKLGNEHQKHYVERGNQCRHHADLSMG